MGLLKKKISLVVISKDMPVDIWVFTSQYIDEIKNANTNMVFKKSCLIVQIYNDFNKDLILTKLPIIQQVSQHLIIYLATILLDIITKLYFYNIIQAYV